MAKIWFVKEGKQPTIGDAMAQKPLKWCIEKLGLQKSHWKEPLSGTIEIPSNRPDLDAIRPPVAVVIEVNDSDTRRSPEWGTGYYLIHGMRPDGAKKILADYPN